MGVSGGGPGHTQPTGTGFPFSFLLNVPDAVQVRPEHDSFPVPRGRRLEVDGVGPGAYCSLNLLWGGLKSVPTRVSW